MVAICLIGACINASFAIVAVPLALPIRFTLGQLSGAVCAGRQLATSYWNNKHALTAWQLLRSSTSRPAAMAQGSVIGG